MRSPARSAAGASPTGNRSRTRSGWWSVTLDQLPQADRLDRWLASAAADAWGDGGYALEETFPDPPTWAAEDVNAETFDHDQYLNGFDRLRLDTEPSYRRGATPRGS